MDSKNPDLLVGASAIAEYLGLTLRQVYAMREAHHPALIKEPGLGLCARKSTLDAIGRPTASAA
jgi:hypothetical protein